MSPTVAVAVLVLFMLYIHVQETHRKTHSTEKCAQHTMRSIVKIHAMQVMAGQGTVAVEMLQQIPGGQIDVCIIPVGGGGLIGGIAAYLKSVCPGCWVVGAQPAASDIMRQSVEAGRIVDAASEETLSDATAGWLA